MNVHRTVMIQFGDLSKPNHARNIWFGNADLQACWMSEILVQLSVSRHLNAVAVEFREVEYGSDCLSILFVS